MEESPAPPVMGRRDLPREQTPDKAWPVTGAAGGRDPEKASVGHKAAEPRSPIPALLWATAVPLRARRCAVSLRQVLVVSVF